MSVSVCLSSVTKNWQLFICLDFLKERVFPLLLGIRKPYQYVGQHVEAVYYNIKRSKILLILADVYKKINKSWPIFFDQFFFTNMLFDSKLGPTCCSANVGEKYWPTYSQHKIQAFWSNFLVRKFSVNGQFPRFFSQFAQKSVETFRLRKRKLDEKDSCSCL